MSESHIKEPFKIFAPKPLKLKTNVRGLKITHEVEHFNSFSFTSSNTRKSYACKSTSSINGINTHSKFNHRRSLINLEEANKNTNDLRNSLEEIEKDFQEIVNDTEESMSKCEIFSILRNDSTNFESFNEDTCLHTLEDESIITDIRISMPPIRSTNPFYKNFELNENKNDEDTTRITCLKSSLKI